MAREKDQTKREAILAAAERLFAERGYHGTSVADMAAEVELPVGSIYTYFENKEAVLAAVIEEGWTEFLASLREGLGGIGEPRVGMSMLINRFLPGLFRKADFITILLAEAGRGSLDGLSVGLEAKLASLSDVILPVISGLPVADGTGFSLSPSQMKAAISIYFLGTLYTIRLSRSAGLLISEEELLAFIRSSIENSFGISLDGPEAA